MCLGEGPWIRNIFRPSDPHQGFYNGSPGGALRKGFVSRPHVQFDLRFSLRVSLREPFINTLFTAASATAPYLTGNQLGLTFYKTRSFWVEKWLNAYSIEQRAQRETSREKQHALHYYHTVPSRSSYLWLNRTQLSSINLFMALPTAF